MNPKKTQQHSEELNTSLQKLLNTEAAQGRARDVIREAEKIGKMGTWEIDIDSRKVTWSEGIYRIREVDDLSI